MAALNMRKIQARKCICIAIAITVLLIVYFTLFVEREEPKSIELTKTEAEKPREKKNKLILFYVPFFGKADYYFGLGRKPFLDRGCKVNTCETTTDKRRILDSDAVIFHPYDIDLKSNNPFPNERTLNQRWIFHISESADHIDLNWNIMKGVFNWTTCYRTDCDIYHPYLRALSKKPEAETVGEHVVPAKKRGLVSWLVSNCKTKGKREEYVQELKKYVSVDIYGACGQRCPPGSKEQCNDLAFNNYKFYLAFENSVCKDYVTEKLLNALNRDIVPIVYGAANYSLVAPPNSVINIMDFSSPKQLADHLIQLDNDDKLYSKYFQWKTKYEVKYFQAFCDLCEKLHEKHEPKVIEDLYDFYVTKADCKHTVQGFPH